MSPLLRLILSLAVLLGPLAASLGGAHAAAATVELKGLDAVKFFYQRGDYPQAKMCACVVAWDDIWQPEALWMTQVRCDLHPLHGLYAWRLFGGRKDLKPDWIHNAQGTMHRSGAKLMDEIQGRRGVLFCIPSKKSHKLSRLFWDGPAEGKVLRIGTMAYNFPYVLNVLVGGKQVFSRTVGKDAWQDLRIPLESEVSKGSPLVLELVIPEDQRWMEGLFFDYIDFRRGPFRERGIL